MTNVFQTSNVKPDKCQFCHDVGKSKQRTELWAFSKVGYMGIYVTNKNTLMIKPSKCETSKIKFCPMCGRRLIDD